jgi:hypothetical protein
MCLLKRKVAAIIILLLLSDFNRLSEESRRRCGAAETDILSWDSNDGLILNAVAVFFAHCNGK